MYIETPIEDFVVEALISDKPASLVVLCGNAGDGKSMFIRRIRERLPGKNLKVNWDATHATTQTGTLADNVDDFLSPFRDDAPEDVGDPSIIAINTGVLVAFFEGKHKDRYSWLRQRIYRTLELPIGDANPSIHKNLRVLVIDLDTRDPFSGPHPLLFRMLDRLSIAQERDPNSLFNDLLGDECSCVVRQNIDAFASKHFREGLRFILHRAQLAGTHFTMRSLWDILARLALGGRTEWSNTDCPFDAIPDRWKFRAEHVMFESTDPPLGQFKQEDPAKATSRELDRMCWQISQKPAALCDLEQQFYNSLSKPQQSNGHPVVADLIDDGDDSSSSIPLDEHLAMRQRTIYFAMPHNDRLKYFDIQEWNSTDRFTTWMEVYHHADAAGQTSINETLLELRQQIETGITQLFLRNDGYALVPDPDARREYQLFREIGSVEPRIDPPRARDDDERKIFEYLPSFVESFPILLYIDDTERFLRFSLNLPLFEALDRAKLKYRLGLADIQAFSRFKRICERIATLVPNSKPIIVTNGLTTLSVRRNNLNTTIGVINE